ncbi:MAG: hypothetical protein VR72_17810 [Clostridiaceae bacterium BRH_c20a]|nr:MAG: hypothetical protein VR72_17810 [Clostridiaceae bacterium BRH_c20a]
MGENIRDRIDRIGLKINFLAQMVGKSPSYVSKLISGDIVNYDSMEKLKTVVSKYEEELKKSGL